MLLTHLMWTLLKACIPRRSEILLCAVQFVIEEDGHGPEAGKIPPFWGFPHDESDDDSKLTALLFTLVLCACDAELAALLLCSVIDLSFSVFTLHMSKLSSDFMRHFRDDALGTMRQGQYAGGTRQRCKPMQEHTSNSLIGYQ